MVHPSRLIPAHRQRAEVSATKPKAKRAPRARKAAAAPAEAPARALADQLKDEGQ